MRDRETPERLLGSQYLEEHESYRIFKHDLSTRIDTHWHDFYEMGFVRSGKGIHKLNGEPFPLCRGMVFLLSTADFHEIAPDAGENILLFNMIFKDAWVRSELAERLFEHGAPHIHTLHGDELSRMEAEFVSIWTETEERRFGHEWLVQDSVERVLVDLARRRPAKIPNSDSYELVAGMHPSIRKALVYVQHHFREPITLGSIAAYAGLSANYFSECFHKQTKVTFQEYVGEKRLLFASALLGSTRLPVTEICYAAGFNTIPHFEKSFKRKYGMSPREYRNHTGAEAKERI
ncbi:helix-turn-helix domain-containing protein [Paenibacillus sp. strain BS8-2]